MFRKIISLVLILSVDYAFGNCGSCQANFIACHSEETFSLCVEGKPTNSVIRCPKDKICTDDPAICVPRDNTAVVPSCVIDNLPIFDGQNFLKDDMSNLAGTYASGGLRKEANVLTSTQCSDITFDPTVIEVSNDDISTISDERSTTDYLENDIGTTTENSFTSTDSAVTNEEISAITEDSSLTEITESSSELYSSSTEAYSTNDISTTYTDMTTRAPRDATTFCSENKEIGTFRAEGDTTCKLYYVCTTSKDSFIGYEFSCIENSYFNSEISLCQRDKPKDC